MCTSALSGGLGDRGLGLSICGGSLHDPSECMRSGGRVLKRRGLWDPA